MLTTSELFLSSIEIFILVLKIFSAHISYYISSKTSNPICKADLFLEWIQVMFSVSANKTKQQQHIVGL